MFEQQSKEELKSIPVRKNSKLLSDLSMAINKFKILAHLQNGSKKQQQQIGSMAEANKIIATHLTQAFELLMGESADGDLKFKIMQEINNCDKTMKLLQIKLIDTVQILMKGLCVTFSEEQTIESLYQQFYVSCSRFMNLNYQHSNQICMILSKKNQQIERQYQNCNGTKKNQNKSTQINTQKNQYINENDKSVSKSSKSKQYFLLKHLLDKISTAKKIYQTQIRNYESQITKLQNDLQQSKKQISNLINTRDQLIEDLCEFQQAIETGKFQQVRFALNGKNHGSKEQNRLSKVKQLKRSIQLQRNDSITKLNEDIRVIASQKTELQKQNEQLKTKIEQYRNQIFRAARIMSLQNRQICIGDEKVKQYRNNLIEYSRQPVGSKMSAKYQISPLLIQSKIATEYENPSNMRDNVNENTKNTQRTSASLVRTKSPVKFVYKNYEPLSNY